MRYTILFMRVINWIKTHKLSSILMAIILFPFLSGIYNNMFGVNISNLSLPEFDNLKSNMMSRPYYAPSSSGDSYSAGGGGRMVEIAPEPIIPPISNSQVSGGMVMKSSTLSLLVNDVRGMADKVISEATAQGGFMISSSFSNPGEAPKATVTVRIPAGNLDTYLKQLRSQVIRVTSENLEGYDITDQYTDTQKRLETLNGTRQKLEAIYAKATEVQDILDVQSRLFDNQNQIDKLKGQIQYMEKSVQLARVTVYLSTDELELPYDSDTSWRPAVVFKQAVRSVLSTLHGLLNFVIWVIVYGLIWIPLIFIIYIIRRRMRRKSNFAKKV